MVDKKVFKQLLKKKALEAAGRWKNRENVRKMTGTVKGSSTTEERVATKRVENHFAREAVRRPVNADLLKPLVFPERIIKGNDLKELPPTEQARLAGKPVARIETIPAANNQAEGFATGFLVSPNLLMTNYHVFPDSNSAKACAANFLYERTSAGINKGFQFLIDPEKFYLADENLDFALVFLEPLSLDNKFSLSGFNFLRLINTPGKILVGQAVNIIQHPSGNIKHYAYQNNTVVDILNLEEFIHYSTDTQRGSSGSPCYNSSWEVVALHHSGVPLIVNGVIMNVQGGPWDEENQDDDEIQWIANEGISISCIVEHLKTQKMGDAVKQALLDALIRTTYDPLFSNNGNEVTPIKPPAVNNINQASSNNNSMSSITLNFNGNTNVYIGDTGIKTDNLPAPVVLSPASRVISAGLTEKKQNFDTDYSSRKGYNRKFLRGLTVELPDVISSRMDEMFLSFSDNKPYVLKYHHYSLAMSKKRRLAMWSASNVSFDPAKRSSKERDEFGTEDWRPDPRIPAKYQIVDEEFYKPAKKIDRGHIVRRADNCWGDSELLIEYANADTYHWTNCTPQHQSFNRDAFGEKGLWGMLENQVQQQLTLVDSKAIIFAGPILDNENDPVATINGEDVQYPLKFWKIIMAIDDQEGLISYGFILDQTNVVDDQGIGIEKLDFSKFKTEQANIHAISNASGVVFDKQLYDTDVLKDMGAEARRSFRNVNEMVLRRNK